MNYVIKYVVEENQFFKTNFIIGFTAMKKIENLNIKT